MKTKTSFLIFILVLPLLTFSAGREGGGKQAEPYVIISRF